ncbi:MAG: glycerophosphodiester phosphodiesterase family protein, partial [Vagococcus sp.]
MTMVLAHRGSKGTHPENTLAAFKEAVRVKSEGIELDVQLSLDNHLVVIHDGEVDRTTNGQGLVKEYTLKELKEFDAGSWFHEDYNKETIPTFEEVIALLDESDYKGLLNIEIKTDEYDYEGIEEMVLKVITSKEYPFTIMLSSFNTETMKRLIALNNTFEKAIILDSSKRK